MHKQKKFLFSPPKQLLFTGDLLVDSDLISKLEPNIEKSNEVTREIKSEMKENVVF
jgi:hypothetical protein